MTRSLDRRELMAAASAALVSAMAVPNLAIGQEASPPATPIPVATLPEPTDDGIDVPVLGIAFGSNEIIATPEVPAGTVRLLTAVPYEDFGSLIFRMPDDQPDAIDQIWAGFAKPEPEIPAWLSDCYFPGGFRTDFRFGSKAEGFVTLLPGPYGVLDFSTGQSTTFVAAGEAADPVAISAAVEVTALDTMTFTGLEEELPTGRSLWQLTNGGQVTHNIIVYGTPPAVTTDDILASITSEDEAAFDGYTSPFISTSTLSPGGVNSFYLDLQPGPHAAMCTETDEVGSPPHFFMGMIVTFEVS